MTEKLTKSAPSVSMIVIGDEILSGRTQDLNARWLSTFLFKAGLTFKSLRFVRDSHEDIKKALDDSLMDSDVVITSGGIGPTVDDKTKMTLAQYFKKNILEREDTIPVIKDNYLRFNREWSPQTNQYHFFPEDFLCISNPKGLAPGLGYLTRDQKLILAAPGVPREFIDMVQYEFFTIIQKTFADRLSENFQTVIRTQGIPEEKIFFDLCPSLWNELSAFGSVSSLPHTLGIDIVVSYYGDQKTHLDKTEKINNLIKKSKLLPYVWQWGNEPLNEMVLNLALQKKRTFAFAESCTGGLCSSKITDLKGASQVFMGSVISYDNSVKKNLLGVKETTLSSFGAVSIEVAKEMALGLRNLLKVDYAISVTGIAGPDGGSSLKPVGLVAIGFASDTQNEAALFEFPGDRLKLKDRFSDKALLTLYEQLKARE